jgi:molybdenum cofactor biosynthesis enzyme MoaA
MSAAEVRSAIAAGHPGTRLVAEGPEHAGSGPRRGAGPARYWALRSELRSCSGLMPHEAALSTRSGQASTAEDDGARVFGIISPITEHFCDTCNRLRLSATGALHSCLAYDDALDLRDPLAKGGERAVVNTIRQALAGKRPKHEFGLLGIGGPRKAMIQIGG